MLIIHENKALYDDLLERSEDIRDRDMIILYLDSMELESFPPEIDIAAMKLNECYQFKAGKTESLLIGKDGHVKLRATSPDIEKIFTLIDSMPMRQFEMKKKGN